MTAATTREGQEERKQRRAGAEHVGNLASRACGEWGLPNEALAQHLLGDVPSETLLSRRREVSVERKVIRRRPFDLRQGVQEVDDGDVERSADLLHPPREGKGIQTWEFRGVAQEKGLDPLGNQMTTSRVP